MKINQIKVASYYLKAVSLPKQIEIMNLLQRLKPEVLVALNEYWIKYPTLGQDLIDALEGHEWIHDIRFGFVQDLLGMVPYAPHQSVYDLFLEA